MKPLIAGLALLSGWCANVAAAAEYRLSEHLDCAWQGELISFPARFEEGSCEALGAVTADGRAVVFQAPEADIERHPDGSIAAARVYVRTDLAPGQTIVFRVLSGREAGRSATTPEGPDLRIVEDDDQVTIESGDAGVRLPLGTFADDIPGPYRGFKLANGKWTGASRMLGEPGPTGLRAEVTERGPLFAEVVLDYTYPRERRYALRCRLIAGDAVVLFAETADVEAGCRYHRNLSALWQGRFGYHEAFEQSHRVRLAFTGFQPDREALATYADMPKFDALVYPGRDPDDSWLTTLHPWQSWHGGTYVLPLRNQTEYLGLMALRAGRWMRPLENLVLVKQDDGGIFLELPINHGRREWGVHFGDPSAAEPTGELSYYPHFTNASRLRQALIRYGQTALDTVKDWDLVWRDAQKAPNPASVVPAGDLAAVHARIEGSPELAAFAAELTNQWQRAWAGQTQEKLQPPLYGGRAGHAPQFRGGLNMLYLCTGEKQHARDQLLMARAQLDYGIRQTLGGVGHHGYPTGHNYGMLNMVANANAAWPMVDALLGSPHLSDGEKQQLRARLAFYAYLLTDRDYWPPTNEIGKGNFNMVASHDGAVGIIGSVLARHPRAADWQAVGRRMLERVLSNFIYPDGVMHEGTHYSGVTMDSMLAFMALLKNAGGTDYFLDPRFQKGMRWYAGICPPVDVRFGRAYMPPYGYSHPTDTSQSARWAVAGALTAESDPEFSKLMMDTWRRQGKPLALNIVGSSLIGMLDPSLIPEKPVERRSAAWTRWGAVLRAHATTEQETYLSICDWGGWTSESGAFHLYAKGVPMSLIFGARAYFNPAAWYSGLTMNRVVFDRREEPRHTRPTGLRRWASLDTADFFGTEFRFAKLQGRAAVFEGDEEDPGALELSEPRPWPKGAPAPEDVASTPHSRFGDVEDVPVQTWQRSVMFVKDGDPLGPNYFLVRDTIDGTLPTEWNLWLMAGDAPAIAGRKARFDGLYDVDLKVFVAEPPANIVTGAWGPGEGARRTWHHGIERQRLLQLQREAGKDYLVALYPHKPDETIPAFSAFGDGRGIRVDWAERSDWLFLPDAPDWVEGDGVHFYGRCALAQRGPHWTRLSLLDGHTIALGKFLLMQGREVVETVRTPGEGALSVTAVSGPEPRITGEADGNAREVVLHVPAEYAELAALRIDGEPARLRPEGYGIYAFQVPAGRHRFEIE